MTRSGGREYAHALVHGGVQEDDRILVVLGQGTSKQFPERIATLPAHHMTASTKIKNPCELWCKREFYARGQVMQGTEGEA